jgi:hypothetical protein
MGQVNFILGQVKWLALPSLGQVLKKSICLLLAKVNLLVRMVKNDE